MTDFFALFGQPRQPWLEPNVLKEKHHELTRSAHPDVRGHEIFGEFEEINEAYRILSEPKLRIQHLLQLEGKKSSTNDRSVPSDLQELFLQIGTLCQETQRILAISDGSTALARSLAKSNLLQVQRQTGQLLEQLSHSYDAGLAELRSLNDIWNNKQEEAVHHLQQLHDRMAYLSRWIAQLKEMELQFTLRG
jgi:DnaJ-domain-containing protein 1